MHFVKIIEVNVLNKFYSNDFLSEKSLKICREKDENVSVINHCLKTIPILIETKYLFNTIY